MGNAIRFKHTNVPRQNREIARFKVVRGPDHGAVYILVGSPASIGRGDENDIVISDLKASRRHARVEWNPQYGCKVVDDQSSNGILHNNIKVKESKLVFGDSISLGETILEYVPSDVGSQVLQAPARSIEQIQAEQEKLKQLKAERFGVGSLKTLFGSQSSKAIGEKKGNKNLLLIVALGAALFLMLGEDPDDQQKKSNPIKKSADATANNTVNLSSYLPVPPDTARTIETLYKEGMREYFDGNYSRAKAQFETILEISPSHPLANLYLQNCDTAIKDAVKLGLDQGKKAFDAGKLREARAFYAQVLRYLYRNKDNPAYKEAKEQLDRVNKAIREGATDK